MINKKQYDVLKKITKNFKKAIENRFGTVRKQSEVLGEIGIHAQRGSSESNILLLWYSNSFKDFSYYKNDYEKDVLLSLSEELCLNKYIGRGYDVCILDLAKCEQEVLQYESENKFQYKHYLLGIGSGVAVSVISFLIIEYLSK